jgi:hypothetical protein
LILNAEKTARLRELENRRITTLRTFEPEPRDQNPANQNPANQNPANQNPANQNPENPANV